MRSSSMQENNPRNKNQPRVVSSYPSSSSTSSAMLPLRRRNMEEVWRDISIPPSSPPPPPPPQSAISLHSPNPNPNPNPTTSCSSSFRGIILQDFLAGPVKETGAAASLGPPIVPADSSEVLSFPLPPTALSLNSGLRFDCHSATGNCSLVACSNRQQQQQQQVAAAAAVAARNDNRQQRQQLNSETFVSPAVAAFSDINGIVGSPPAFGLFSFCPASKRILDNSDAGFDTGDRRHKRMMKNRESAARSRARKQAYTNELELEVAHLVAENDKLRKQYEELSSAMAAHHSTKKTLQRTLTAPF